MGLLTLADFRTDLQSALGDKGITNPRLDRWINYAYTDVCSAIEFEILANDETVNTVASTQTITAPTNTLVIQFIKDTTNDVLLGWVPKNELFRRSITPEAAPTSWTRHKGLIYLHNVPSGIVALLIGTIEPPAILATTGAVTVIPNSWDAAVFMLSVHYGLLALGEENRSTAWLSRGITYMQSRMTEEDLQANASGLGASLPNAGMQSLMNRLQAGQGAS